MLAFKYGIVQNHECWRQWNNISFHCNSVKWRTPPKSGAHSEQQLVQSVSKCLIFPWQLAPYMRNTHVIHTLLFRILKALLRKIQTPTVDFNPPLVLLWIGSVVGLLLSHSFNSSTWRSSVYAGILWNNTAISRVPDLCFFVSDTLIVYPPFSHQRIETSAPYATSVIPHVRVVAKARKSYLVHGCVCHKFMYIRLANDVVHF